MSFKKSVKAIIADISPELLSKIIYWVNFKKKLNLKDPQNICEKNQWLKFNTYRNNPIVTQCADKYKVREYVKEKNCSEILNELLDVWDNSDQIQWDKLPDKFVIKCNHGCGYNIICDGKEKFNFIDIKNKLDIWMKEDYWKLFGEINYKYIPKKIICEKYLNDGHESSLRDYKFFCIHGEVEVLEVCMNRTEHDGHPEEYYFDKNWNYLPPILGNSGLKNGADKLPEKPQCFEKMLEYSKTLSEDFPFVRVDFYEVNNKVIFSELTFTSAGGFDLTLMDVQPNIGEKLQLNI